MALNADGKWVVQSGDCLWKIAQSCYNDASRWPEIAKANGVSLSTAIIHTGQVLTIPGVTSSSGSGTTVTVPSGTTPQDDSKYLTPKTNQTVGVVWWKLRADRERDMYCAWEFDRANTDHYEVKVYAYYEDSGWNVPTTENPTEKGIEVSVEDDATKIKISIKPIAQQKSGGGYYWTDGKEVTLEYDYANNPPGMPPTPTHDLDLNDELTITFTNIDPFEDLKANYIEIWVYQDSSFLKSQTGRPKINEEMHEAVYKVKLEPGHKYTYKYRGVREVQGDGENQNGIINGSWSDYVDSFYTSPIAPKEITSLETRKTVEQSTVRYGVLIKWDKIESAKNYRVEYSKNSDFLSDVDTYDTLPEDGTQAVIMGIDLGYIYYFRLRSFGIDDSLSSSYSEVKSLTLGTKPSAPTTYSNVTSCTLGDDLKLYWIHNSTDGSLEEYAVIEFVITDFSSPMSVPLTKYEIIENTRPIDDPGPGMYVINIDDEFWSRYTQGFLLKWRVRTCGVTDEYGDYSVEREASMYITPTLTLDIRQNPNSENSGTEISQFPFYIYGSVTPKVSSTIPITQTPISYYIEIISQSEYDVPDLYGNASHINIGDTIYKRYFDANEFDDKWVLIKEMMPSDITLQNGANYTINVSVSMSSGLTAFDSLDFSAYIANVLYNVYADVIINKESLEANIKPYCYEYLLVEDPEPGHPTTEPQLVQNCRLSVFRKEYDGSFVEIASNIDNTIGAYVTDPHPALDYARYRIVARNNNGSVNFADINPVKVGEPYIVFQWAEAWTKFQPTDVFNEEPAWSGSMIKIPYNVDITENNNLDVSLIEYIGREHPVSYYGTQLGTTATWKAEIPAYDKETIYNLRRLSRWTGNVYVREPSGSGYWANVSVSFDLTHNNVTVPISFNIRRVEGGI